MFGIKIDYRKYLRHHYWMGWYFWNECHKHRMYESNCDECNKGLWHNISRTKAISNDTKWSERIIFKMPMNNVTWKGPDD